MSKTVLFQTIQFSISSQFSSIWIIDKSLSGATTQSKSGPESNRNKEEHRTPQNSSITGTSLSDCLESFLGHSLVVGGVFPSAEIQLVYSAAPADCAYRVLNMTLDFTWWWDSSSRVLWNVEYPFIDITFSSILTWSGSTC